MCMDEWEDERYEDDAANWEAEQVFQDGVAEREQDDTFSDELELGATEYEREDLGWDGGLEM